jgi:sugar O-acyltransferase (sialic acid O-acetyltransferase NeuD family)
MDQWEPIGFIDDHKEKHSVVSGLKVLGGIDVISSASDLNVVLAFGDPRIKEKVSEQLRSVKTTFPIIIHPGAILQNADSIVLSPGTVVTAGCVLTTEIVIGEHVLINLNSTIGHDCKIGRCSSIMPGVNIAGEVSVGKGVLIGSGSNIRNKVKIGDHSIVGMGSAVIHDVAENDTVAGVPAKSLHTK